MGKTIRNTKTRTDESKYKSKVRARVAWKRFRERLKKERKVCELTLKPLSRNFECHHKDLDIEHYEMLVDDHFCVLNNTAHETIHYLYRYVCDGDFSILDRLSEILHSMYEINHAEKTEKTEKTENSGQ
ncbi:MAG: hypothetical protein KBS62_00960 [Oscillospiraceae bacterium]|nr:hypothetical protein [Candidatus Ruminococcus equi]